MKNLTLANITEACQGVYHGDSRLLDKEAAGVAIDSRKVEKDFLFVAINGERFNAHTFIPETIEKGALCVVSHEDLGDTDYPYILVEATGQALLDIAKLYRDSFDVKVVGITGSVGKTSTKEMIASVLAEKYNVHKTQGNFNNECGLPLTIFEMNEAHQVSVLEMGINHFGEMRKLSSVASPDICVITNIGVAHLEFLKTQEGILQEKTQMFQDMKHGGSIILNGDDPLLSTLGSVKGADPVFYGMNPETCDIFADALNPLGLKGTACTIHLPEEAFSCVVPTPGLHMVSNALAGAAVGYTLGLTAEEIKRGIESLPFMPGRNNIIQTGHMILLDDCYNANTISMKAALDVLNMAIGRKVAVLGDMGELGDNWAELHRTVGSYAAELGIDLVCTVGELAAEIATGAKSPDTAVKHFPTKEAFLAQAGDILLEGDNVLIKASHGMEFPEIVEALKKL